MDGAPFYLPGKRRAFSLMDSLSGTDRIDLSAIDINSGTSANDAFASIGNAAFSNVAGERRAHQSTPGSWFVQGDVNGDGLADFAIQVNTAGPLVVGDFTL